MYSNQIKNYSSNTHLRLCLLIALITIATVATSRAEPIMNEIAVKSERPAGAPEYADVCFRYGWVRKDKFPTVDDAKQAIRAFHATRVDWFYPGTHTTQDGAKHVTPESKAFIDWCHANDMKIGGAINNNTKNPDWKYKKHHLDRYVGEPSIPAFVADVVAWGKAQIDAGVDTMVCDDIFKYDAPRQRLWSDQVLKKLKAYKPGFTIAGNSGHNIGTGYVRRYAVDFHYSDNNFVPSPRDWWSQSKAHRALKSAILLHPNRPISKQTHRQMIALGYANGAHVITPWDEYIHGKARLFADPADFADLYGFVRALGEKDYLNGYEDAAVGGYDLKENRYGEHLPIAVAGGSGKLSVFARAKPGQTHTPAVFHLVESDEPKAAKLRLRKSALFGTSKVVCKLLVPTPYAKADHEAAAASGDYESLCRISTLAVDEENGHLVVDLPPLNPWGVLIISPASNE